LVAPKLAEVPESSVESPMHTSYGAVAGEVEVPHLTLILYQTPVERDVLPSEPNWAPVLSYAWSLPALVTRTSSLFALRVRQTQRTSLLEAGKTPMLTQKTA
jgi:hypothetical protein